jgi:hypothetical protein
MSGDSRVLRQRKRPKETSSKAKTARVPFGNQATKELSIPVVVDRYNYYMGAVDEFDHLIAQNSGLRHVVRGGYQALEHWLLRTVLVNCYLLALCSDVPEPREINFRSQADFRRQLVTALIAKGREGEVCPKRRISRISQGADQVPTRLHEQVKLRRRGICVYCKGLRFKDRLKKRVALAQIASNQGRKSSQHVSIYGCKQCDVSLCRDRGCFDSFHRSR